MSFTGRGSASSAPLGTCKLKSGSGCGLMADDIDQYTPLQALRGEFNISEWKPPGPKSLAYTQSTALIRAMAGPVGCAKTTTAEINEVFCAIKSPQCLDGVRRYSCLTIRDTYRQLYKTAIATWNAWFPQTVGKWSGGQDRPAEHRLLFIDDYGPVEFTMMFAAIPDQDIRDWLDGFEVSSIFMNAATSLPAELLRYGASRIGRYPAQRLLPKGYKIDKHIAMDLNKSDVDSWLYEMLVLNLNRDTTDFFDFPGGLDPDAENIKNLNPTYYQDMLRLNPKWWVDIYVNNRWGPSRDGRPVFDTFRQNRHVANGDFDALEDLPLMIGLDAGTLTGGRPSAVFFQVTPFGRARVVDELYLGRCGPTRFFNALIERLSQPHLAPAAHDIRAWCDPSAFGGADEESGELTWVQVGEEALGITIEMPESNELENFRLETIRILLGIAEGDELGLVLSPRCKILIKGFNSGYFYEIKQLAAGVKEDPKPKKNDCSHPMDALGHGLTGHFGKAFVEGAVRHRLDPSRTQHGAWSAPGFSANFDLFGS